VGEGEEKAGREKRRGRWWALSVGDKVGGVTRNLYQKDIRKKKRNEKKGRGGYEAMVKSEPDVCKSRRKEPTGK